jgi:hypothetical protein
MYVVWWNGRWESIERDDRKAVEGVEERRVGEGDQGRVVGGRMMKIRRGKGRRGEGGRFA